MNFMKKEWNVVKAFTVCIAISLAIIIFGVLALCVNGLPLGIEFAGGVELTVDFNENDVTQNEYNTIKSELKDYLESAGLSVSDGSKISEGDIIDGVKFSYALEINGKTVEDGVMGTLFTMLEKGGSELTAEDIAVLDDYYSSMERGDEQDLMEVKGCTLEIDGTGYFPDAPTERGVKHLRELAEAAGKGYCCYVAFVIQMEGVKEVLPYTVTHPEFGVALQEARDAGVEVLYLQCKVEPDTLMIREDVPGIL